ncbi:hypothetical protein T484DRAFT_1832259, partial [Baffinella frigidus]
YALADEIGIYYADSDVRQDGTITDVITSSRGANYVPGGLSASAPDFSGTHFVANFTVDGGAVASVWIMHHGVGFASTPRLAILYPGSSIEQTNSIRDVDISQAGVNFVAGDLKVVGGGGAGFTGTFSVDASGGVNATDVSAYGGGFTSDPVVMLCYTGTNIDMNNSVTSVGVSSAGVNFLAGHVIAPNSSAGVGGEFAADFSVDALGGVTSVSVTSHGEGILSAPDLVLAYSGTTDAMSGSISSVRAVSAGANYDDTPGVLRINSTFLNHTGSDFAASVTTLGGSVLSVSVTAHGSGYGIDPTASDVSLYYGYATDCGSLTASTQCVQEGSVTKVEVLR